MNERPERNDDEAERRAPPQDDVEATERGEREPGDRAAEVERAAEREDEALEG